MLVGMLTYNEYGTLAPIKVCETRICSAYCVKMCQLVSLVSLKP